MGKGLTMKDKINKVTFSETLKISWRALKISVHVKNKFSLFINLVGFAMAFIPVWISKVLGQFTDQIQLLSQKETTIQVVLTVFILLIALYMIQTIYNYAHDYCMELDIQQTMRYIKKTIIDCASKVQYKYIENEDDFRDKLAFAEMFGGVQVADSMQQIILILQQIITFASVAIVLGQINSWIVIVLLITSIPAGILSILQKDDEYKEKTKNMKEGAMSVHLFYMAAGANEHCRSLNDVRFNGIFPWLKDKWRAVSKDYLKKKNAVTKKYVVYNCIADLLRNGVYIGVLLLTVYQIYKNPSLGLGTFTLVYTLSGQLQTVTTKLFTGVTCFLGNAKYMRDFFDLCDTPREIMEENPVDIQKADISFHHVSFTYPNSEIQALKDVTVSIKQGEKIAIVGENGSGKSTFVNLLCGLYEPESGEILVGKYRIKEHLAAIRRIISVVFQNFGRYETSIRKNITVADGECEVSDEDLKIITVRTNAWEFIKEQKNGLDEVVGIFSESGNNLSGGQWQKVALSRALYRKKSKILILDEPTAALDPLAEAKLYRDFADITEDKTTILISHRLGITSIVDRVLVFQNGKIVEDGSHYELLKKGGIYTRMYQAQAQWYEDRAEN